MADLSNLVDDTFVLTRLQALVECLCEELAKAGGPSLCYCGLMVGTAQPIGLMNCSDGGGCGKAWVRPDLIFPSTSFPSPDDEAVTACAAPLAIAVEIGVTRCAPRPNGRDGIDPQQMFDATRLYLSDMRAMRQALLCCFPKRNANYRSALGQWTPIEIAAGVSGGSWSGWIG